MDHNIATNGHYNWAPRLFFGRVLHHFFKPDPFERVSGSSSAEIWPKSENIKCGCQFPNRAIVSKW